MILNGPSRAKIYSNIFAKFRDFAIKIAFDICASPCATYLFYIMNRQLMLFDESLSCKSEVFTNVVWQLQFSTVIDSHFQCVIPFLKKSITVSVDGFETVLLFLQR